MRASPSPRAFFAGVLASVLGLSAFGAGTARAQYLYEPDVMLPPRAVVWRLNDRGFTEVTRPHFDGRAYVVEASSPYGDRVRLFVDARDGGIIGRQRLDATFEPPARVVRRAPGYGWTEEDAVPRRPIREAERIVPPADIPFPQESMRRARPDTVERPEPVLRSASPARPDAIDRNPMGLNPDARGTEPRPATETPRKVVRLNPPAKAVTAPATPPAPKLSDVPPTAAKVEAAPGAASAAVEPPKVVSPAASGSAMTPATNASSNQPPADKPAAQAWKDLPADAKRPVRVIGGATVVPGTTAKDADKD